MRAYHVNHSACVCRFGGPNEFPIKNERRGAILLAVDLSGADLRGANLRGADLRGANLRAADLRRANLHGADLNAADLTNAKATEGDLGRAALHETGAASDKNLAEAVKAYAESEVKRIDEELERRILEASANKFVESLPGVTKHDLADFDVVLSADLSKHQIETALNALADYYRACGGAGFNFEFALSPAVSPEHVRQ